MADTQTNQQMRAWAREREVIERMKAQIAEMRAPLPSGKNPEHALLERICSCFALMLEIEVMRREE